MRSLNDQNIRQILHRVPGPTVTEFIERAREYVRLNEGLRNVAEIYGPMREYDPALEHLEAMRDWLSAGPTIMSPHRLNKKTGKRVRSKSKEAAYDRMLKAASDLGAPNSKLPHHREIGEFLDTLLQATELALTNRPPPRAPTAFEKDRMLYRDVTEVARAWLELRIDNTYKISEADGSFRKVCKALLGKDPGRSMTEILKRNLGDYMKRAAK